VVERSRVDGLVAEAVRCEALRIAPHIVGLDLADYDDVAQEACLRVWARFDQCRAEESFGAWVRAVVQSVACTVRQKRRRWRGLAASEVHCASHGTTGPGAPDATVDHRRHLLRLHRDAEGLSPSLRVVYLRTLLGGEDIADTAAALGVHRSVVDQRVRRVRLALAPARCDGDNTRSAAA